jgi:hypothetical protein
MGLARSTYYDEPELQISEARLGPRPSISSWRARAGRAEMRVAPRLRSRLTPVCCSESTPMLNRDLVLGRGSRLSALAFPLPFLAIGPGR